MSRRSVSLHTWIKIWPVVASLLAAVFGYGILNQKVEALEKNEVRDTQNMTLMNQHIITIMADVAYIRGNLDGSKKTNK